MAGTGLFLGFRLNLLAFFLGCVLGAAIHLCRMKFPPGATWPSARISAAGAVLALLWGDALLTWYLGLLF
jgi:leader peptidase (prepilin peptidase)/N-methyltransferase